MRTLIAAGAALAIAIAFLLEPGGTIAALVIAFVLAGALSDRGVRR